MNISVRLPFMCYNSPALRVGIGRALSAQLHL